MKKTLLSVLPLCILALNHPAEAGVFVTISANGQSVSCNNESAVSFSGCRRNGFVSSINSAVITFSGSVGGYELLNLTVVGNVPGDALAAVTASTTRIAHIEGAGDLTVDFGATDFTSMNSAILFLTASDTANWTIGVPGDSVRLQAWARPDNLAAVPGGTSSTILAPIDAFGRPAQSGAAQGVDVPFTAAENPYALTGRSIIRSAVGTVLGYQGTVVTN